MFCRTPLFHSLTVPTATLSFSRSTHPTHSLTHSLTPPHSLTHSLTHSPHLTHSWPHYGRAQSTCNGRTTATRCFNLMHDRVIKSSWPSDILLLCFVHSQFCIELVIFLAACVTVSWQQAASYTEVVPESESESDDDDDGMTIAFCAGGLYTRLRQQHFLPPQVPKRRRTAVARGKKSQGTFPSSRAKPSRSVCAVAFGFCIRRTKSLTCFCRL